MKKFQEVAMAGALVLGVGFFPGLNPASGQTKSELEIVAYEPIVGLEMIPLEAAPEFGTFWSLQKSDSEFGEPPVPFNQFPKLPLYSLGGGNYLIDDRSVNYVTLREDVALHWALKLEEAKYGLESPLVPELGIYGESEGGMMMLMGGPPSLPGEGGEEGGGGWTNYVSMAYSYGSNVFWIEITTVSNGVAHLILHGTVEDEAYEVLSKEDLTNAVWISEPPMVMGAEGQDWTATTVEVGTRTNALFFRARSWVDSDGDGLPDWWELENGLDPNNPDTGNTGIPDGYKDGDNDGWNNLQEYQNGTDPNEFNTPPAPIGWSFITTNGNSRVIQWETAGGPVQNYALVKYHVYPMWNEWSAVSTQVVSAVTETITDNDLAPLDEDPDFDPEGYRDAYLLYALYSEGPSFPGHVTDRTTRLNARLLHGRGREMLLALYSFPKGATTIRLSLTARNTCGWNLGTNQTCDISLASFTNGFYALSEQQYPFYTAYTVTAQALNDDGDLGLPRVIESNCERSIRYPFLDGSQVLKDNLVFTFQVQSAVSANNLAVYPLQTEGIGFGLRSGYSLPVPVYGVASYRSIEGWIFHLDLYWGTLARALHPWEINVNLVNYEYANSTDRCYCVTNSLWGTSMGTYGNISVYAMNGPLSFDSVAFAFNQTTNPCPSMMSSPIGRGLDSQDPIWPIIESGSSTYVTAIHPNQYGLALQGIYAEYYDPISGQFVTNYFAAGATCPPDIYIYSFFEEFAAPGLQPEFFQFTTGGNLASLSPDKVGTNAGVAITNLLIASVGDADFSVSAWMRYHLTNGASGIYGYVEQYFDKAYKMTNGVVTTNQAGILSPYGYFFPTEPGPVAVTTIPNIDTGQRGTGVVHVIKLQLDVNHDGIMDTTYHGPDNTSAAHPMKFWVNNDHDTWNGKDLDNPKNPNHTNDVIDGVRDLEDFARLWIVGLPELTAFSGYDVQLRWRNTTGNPIIKLYRSAESSGGTGYLTSTNVAVQQMQLIIGAGVTNGFGASVGTVAQGATSLADIFFSSYTETNAYLFEGAGIGSGELVLTVLHGTNVLAQTSAWLDLRDIQELYERGSAENVTAGIPPSDLVSRLRTNHVTLASPDETKQIIVFVHGANITEFQYRSDTETAFKRLYWSGYQGRVASFRWPCAYLPFDNTLNPFNFNRSEFYAWKSAAAFREYLIYLSNRTDLAGYSINILAHSQGNIVVSEALAQGAPFDNYILTQAAVPAHCYDTSTNVPFLQKFLNAEAIKPTPFYPTNGGYHGYFENLSGNIVNFFNPQDYALATGTISFMGIEVQANWEKNHESYKPEDFSYMFGPGYSYLPTTGESRRTYYYPEASMETVTDAYEKMGVIARTRSRAIGAQSDVEGVINTIDSIDLNAAPFFFGLSRDEHSAQFTRAIQNSKAYYDELLQVINVPIP